jgi:hypothetical protein
MDIPNDTTLFRDGDPSGSTGPTERGILGRKSCPMCRNIRVLHNFDPPTTPEEIRAAAVQYVRKVSGLPRPSAADLAAFERAVLEIAASTDQLLESLSARTAVRTREQEREKARSRWRNRESRLPRT